jgi:putative flippase GtrA
MSTPVQLRTSPATLLRFVAVGVCNTIFGYGCFAFFTMLLMPLVAYGYVVASLLSNLVAITLSFLGCKWFVFKTHAHYLREWSRCVGVCTGSMLLSAAALPILVPIVRRQTSNARTAPYIAGAIVLVFCVAFSFFGHRHFSLDRSKPSPEAAQ